MCQLFARARTSATSSSMSDAASSIRVQSVVERWLKVTATRPDAASSSPHETYWPQSLMSFSQSGGPSPWTNMTAGSVASVQPAGV